MSKTLRILSQSYEVTVLSSLDKSIIAETKTLRAILSFQNLMFLILIQIKAKHFFFFEL